MQNAKCKIAVATHLFQCAIRNAQNPSVILSDDSSPFKGAKKAVAPTEHYNAIVVALERIYDYWIVPA